MGTNKPTMVAFPIPLEWVLSGDPSKAVAILTGLVDRAESTQLYAGTLELSFQGWNNDPRELYEIPEVCTWFTRLNDVFPHWFILANRTTGTLPLIYNMLLAPGTLVPDGMGGYGVSHPKSKIADLTVRMFSAMYKTASRQGISEKVVEGWTKDVNECLRAYIG